ncbi:hypothetical protein ACW9HJ_29725 [Nocardia gipuzkoensis]
MPTCAGRDGIRGIGDIGEFDHGVDWLLDGQIPGLAGVVEPRVAR